MTAELDVLAWLEQQVFYPKFYWEEREGTRLFAGVGEALALKEIPSFDAGNLSSARFYGGVSFSGEAYFFLPLFELRQEKGKTSLILNLIEENPLPQPHYASLLSAAIVVETRTDSPSFSGWERSVLEYLQEPELEKIVAGRRTTFDLKEEISPFALLRQLRQKTQKTTPFIFQMSPSTAFLGATPEKFYARQGDALSADVMAGTCPIGKEQELLSGAKERREFNYVKHFIKETLTPFSHHVEEEEDRILTTTSVSHLYNRIQATLKQPISDGELIRHLHPTPAMGGVPRAKALSLLHQKEPFTRGWYAAPIGWISACEVDLCVGIRSALIAEKQLHLFAAAGIVQGSDPLQEWNELEHKIKPFLDILHE